MDLCPVIFDLFEQVSGIQYSIIVIIIIIIAPAGATGPRRDLVALRGPSYVENASHY